MPGYQLPALLALTTVRQRRGAYRSRSRMSGPQVERVVFVQGALAV